MSVAAASYLTLFAPLASCILIAMLGHRLPQHRAGWLGSAAALLSFVGAIGAFAQFGFDAGNGTLLTPYTWLSAGSFDIGLDLYIDPLSIFEMLVISGVGSLIHLYSIGYMHGDPQERRFFAYMNLFLFAMLMLVMAGNLIFLLIGWGLVGLASYLLIGFWHHRPTAVAAAKKAFIVNAVGDVLLMLGIFMIFVRTTSLSYPAVFAGIGDSVERDGGGILLICLLLLGGAVAKSAQLPLHTWLPDAMEGPTPVSALIHAATMVTAGVYLVARMHPLFELSAAASATVAVVGALTLVVAGFLALVQYDIKRIIAYSTMSQIGYMFVAVGVGAYSAGMFHLMTHAFFKALLFLGAGVVIHALAGEQDIRRMGGLRRLMPRTFWLFVIASLALAGVIPLSGFFSKDEIVASAFAAGTTVGYFVWLLALVGVFMTGLYGFRLLFAVFFGDAGTATAAYGQAVASAPAGSGLAADAGQGAGDAHADHVHPRSEGPATMMVPVYVLAVLSAVGGLLVIPGLWDLVGEYLSNADATHTPDRIHDYLEHNVAVVWALSLLSLAMAAGGIGVAWKVWGSGDWARLRTRFAGARPALEAGLGFDAAYHHGLYRPAGAVGRFARDRVEGSLIAPSMDWVARVVRGSGEGVGALQSGLVRTYALGIALAASVGLIWFVVRG